MSIHHRGQIAFPEFSGARCYMMPFIQGRADSLPEDLAPYAGIVESQVLEGQAGEIGLITIDESFVAAGTSQRGYGKGDRTIHTEACLRREGLYAWGGGPTWGPRPHVQLQPEVRVLIANSIDETCMLWDQDVMDTTADGDLSLRADEFPFETGQLMRAGDVYEIGIFTPHEPIAQKLSGNRQFFRIVGKGVTGREEYFTRNPVLEARGIFVN
ncbi:hypothetical protein ACEUZ9_000941 [Paracoccus litorisediminis]|uniref:hypothetical protein n=1 Tax=Paracoccus litorisediminis TaxID=2006130 RepID=UPI00373464CE